MNLEEEISAFESFVDPMLPLLDREITETKFLLGICSGLFVFLISTTRIHDLREAHELLSVYATLPFLLAAAISFVKFLRLRKLRRNLMVQSILLRLSKSTDIALENLDDVIVNKNNKVGQFLNKYTGNEVVLSAIELVFITSVIFGAFANLLILLPIK
jgi:hypothetical protein